MALAAAPGFRGALFATLLALLPDGAAAYSDLVPATGPAPPLVLDRLDGAPFALDEAPRAPVLVHFFATWCPPCIPEMTALDRLAARRAGGPPTIVVVSVAEVDAAVRRFLGAHPASLTVLMDRDRAAARRWGVSSLPTTVLLDADGNRTFVAEGEVDWDSPEVDALIDRLVGHATPKWEEKDEKT